MWLRVHAHLHVVVVHLLFHVLLDLCPSVLKPVLRLVSRSRGSGEDLTDVDLVERNTEALGKALLGAGAGLVVLLKVTFEYVMLVFCAGDGSRVRAI